MTRRDNLTNDLFGTPEAPTEETTEEIFDGETTPPTKSDFKEDKYSPPKRGRESGEKIFGAALIGVGAILVNRRIDPPVGRVLQFESPLAAKKIDDAIAGTIIDRLLQPLFRKSDDIEGLGAVLGLPILVGIYERRPEMAPVLEPMLYEVMGVMMDQLAPVMRKEKTKQRRTARSLADMSETFNLPPGTKDPIAAILGGFIFQDMVPPEEGEENAGGTEP